ncbi:MAG: succinylglutamate desuccinylase/aspartoacylase family protein [Rickettsiales bacterium]|jgi:predicted deacylase|nr:succinylglutamate desuccinylase/aspartoacylase family protein [Rickettsiales bacterium]
MLEIFEFKSLNPGKHILITGAIHGNEVCGAIASQKIISEIESGKIEIKSGSVTFVPISNPEAYRLNRRFVETNLNRVVKKHKEPKLYEEKIANVLIEYIKKADYHLDIHSMCENGKPFVFQDYEEEREFAEIFGLNYIFVGWPDVYKDSKIVKDYSTQNYSHRVGTINCTVECGSNIGKDSIVVAEKSIRRALSYLKIADYEDDTIIPTQNFINMKKVYFRENAAEMTRKFKQLEKIKKGEIIVTYTNGKKIVADDNYFIIFPKYDAIVGEEWFYLGKPVTF